MKKQLLGMIVLGFMLLSPSSLLAEQGRAEGLHKKMLEITYDNGVKQVVRLDQASASISKMEFKQVSSVSVVETPFGGTTDTGLNLKGEVVFLPEGTRSLPDLSRYPVVSTLYTSKIDISPRRFDSGFPGIPNRVEWFGVKYTGEFYVRKAGNYKFRAISDDGIALSIDGRNVLADRDEHAPREVTGDIYLYEGMHGMRMDYYQGPKYDIACQIFVTAPGVAEKIFDLKDFAY